MALLLQRTVAICFTVAVSGGMAFRPSFSSVSRVGSTSTVQERRQAVGVLNMETETSDGEDALSREFLKVLREGKAAEDLGEDLQEVADIPRSPSPEISPRDVVKACHIALKHNDQPLPNSGFATCFAFADSMCRAAAGPRTQKTTLEDFIRYANNPTFGSLKNMRKYSLLGDTNVIDGSPTRGALATQLVEVETSQGRVRKFLWTLQKQRRPPLEDCWLVRECLATERAYYQTL